MGQYSVIAVVAALIFVAVLLLNARLSAGEADEELSAYQVDRFAREVVLVGLKEAERNLADDTDGWELWTTDQTAAQAQFGVAATSHGGGSYAVTIDNMTFGATASDPDRVWLTATGTYDGFNPQTGATGTTTYTVKAAYETGLTDIGVPPGMRDAIVSDELVDVRGNIQISGGIHSNNEIASSGGSFDVHGSGTYTGSESADDSRFSGGIMYSDSVYIPTVAIPPASYHHITSASPAAFTLDPSNDPTGTLQAGWFSVLGKGTEADPYVLYVNGNLEIDGDVRLLGYSRLYVNGTVRVNGNAALSPVTAASPNPNQDVTTAEAWVNANLPNNATMIGIYATGDITLAGTCFVAAHLYTDGAVKYTGGGHKLLIGGITAHDPLDIRGNAKVYYTEASEAIVDPGSNYDVPEGIRLIAYREWAQR